MDQSHNKNMSIPAIFSDRATEIAATAILAVPAIVHAVVDGVGGANTPDWVGSITQISAFGLVAWIVYFMFTTWLPNIQANHSSQLDAQREAHVEAMKTIADAHATAVSAMTAAFQESLKAQRADLLAQRVCKADIQAFQKTSVQQ